MTTQQNSHSVASFCRCAQELSRNELVLSPDTRCPVWLRRRKASIAKQTNNNDRRRINET